MKTDTEIYTPEELQIIHAVENGDYTPVPSEEFKKEKERFQVMAIKTMKRKEVNIEIIEQDIQKIEALALSEGIPYKIYITSILHKVANGKLKA